MTIVSPMPKARTVAYAPRTVEVMKPVGAGPLGLPEGGGPVGRAPEGAGPLGLPEGLAPVGRAPVGAPD